MKQIAIVNVYILLCCLVASFSPASAAGSPLLAQDKIAETTLKVGDEAPDFTLPSNQDTTVKLSDYRGKKNVVLAFYVLAFTGG